MAAGWPQACSSKGLVPVGIYYGSDHYEDDRVCPHAEVRALPPTTPFNSTHHRVVLGRHVVSRAPQRLEPSACMPRTSSRACASPTLLVAGRSPPRRSSPAGIHCAHLCVVRHRHPCSPPTMIASPSPATSAARGPPSSSPSLQSSGRASWPIRRVSLWSCWRGTGLLSRCVRLACLHAYCVRAGACVPPGET